MPYDVGNLVSRNHRRLAVGVANDIARRVRKHRRGLGSRHVKRYRVTRLVHVEKHEEIARAIQCDHPEWDDLYEGLNG
jgi:predicted GIY-YIG superfamily endonuclease